MLWEFLISGDIVRKQPMRSNEPCESTGCNLVSQHLHDIGHGRPKMTPILIDVHAVDAMAMVRQFKAISQELPSGLSELIENKIAEMK